METKARMGEVNRTPLGALKRVCEEYPLTAIINERLHKFERLTDKAVDKKKNSKKQKDNSNRAMFPDGTIDLIHEIQEQRGEGVEELVK